MTRERLPRVAVAAAVALALAVVGAWQLQAGAERIRVLPGTSVTELAARHPGAELVLTPGRHAPFELWAPATVRAEPGAEVVGGDTGVLVRETDGVVLDGLVVRGAELHGIEVVDASAAITGCVIGGLRSPYAQGIEVRNTNTRPRSTIEGCTVTGGQEGIVSHVSRVEVRGNTVSGTTMRAIAVTEMSEGLVEGNVVRDVAGVGLFCGDMSHCELRGNDVAGVADGGNGSLSHSGHAISAAYYSTIRARGNDLSATAAEPVGLYTGSITTDRFPLAVWPPGWRGSLTAIPMTALAVIGLAALRLAAQPVLSWWGGRRAGPRRALALGRSVTAIVLGGFAVQSFHMVEHVVQVWQVEVAESPNRSGLVGASADVEWVHFVFNLLVLAFLVQLWRLGRSSAWLDGASGPAAWMAAALALQGLHLVEHSAKLWQHLTLGIDPGPGIVGRWTDLVWLHYVVNASVWLGTAIAVASLVRRTVVPRLAERCGTVAAPGGLVRS